MIGLTCALDSAKQTGLLSAGDWLADKPCNTVVVAHRKSLKAWQYDRVREQLKVRSTPEQG